VATILLVEDDAFEAQTLSRYLGRAGHSVTIVQTAEEALPCLARDIFDVAIVDLSLPGMSGLDFLKQTRGEGAVPVIVVTGDSDVATVVAAMRSGAQDYVVKPLTMKTLEHVLDRCVETSRLRKVVERLAREVATSDPEPESTAFSPAMKRVLEQARRVGASDASTALIVGESGVGKEVLASYVHRHSARAHHPFVRINVAAMPETMIESELFGAVRGAFTDSKRDRLGFFGAADGGTLLLDEVAELRPELQVKLLRAIETRRYYPVGATSERTTNVRIVAATNQEPGDAVAHGRLRADLYYRLATIVLRVPPLRERREDIAPVARAILSSSRRSTGRGPSSFDEDAIRALEEYPWPGNVRELRNAVERVSILVDSDVATRSDLEGCGIFDAPGARSPSYGAPPPASWPAYAWPTPPGGWPAGTVTPPSGYPRPHLPQPAPQAPAPPAALPAPPPVPRRASGPPAMGAEGAPLTLDEVARVAVAEAEREHILNVLEHTRGNRTRAAEVLGVSRSTLWQKLRRLGLEDS
jgi:DNA-binding NtrC family response regulator